MASRGVTEDTDRRRNADTPGNGSTPDASRRREVLEAARQVIITEGLSATTMRKIATAGGFTTGVVNHYFPDKNAVITATFELSSTEWVDNLERLAAPARSVREKLAVVVEHILPTDRAEQEAWRMWIELFGLAGNDPTIRAQMLTTDERWELFVRNLVAECHREGVLDTPSMDVTAYTLLRLLDGLALRAWVTDDWDTQRTKLVEALRLLGFAEDVVAELRR
jgi:AcrR family transcriptional regulator